MTNAEILARFRECKRLAEEGQPLPETTTPQPEGQGVEGQGEA